MVFPVGDTPNPKGVPFATYLLIALNVAVYVLIAVPQSAVRPDPRDPLLAEYVRVMAEQLGNRADVGQLLAHVSAYDLFVFRWGFRPAAPSLVDLFTSMFLHGGLLHLAGNMLFLWIYGDNVEHRLGRVAFVGWYLATGVAATVFHTLGDTTSRVPMVGASGAISGMLGFYFVWFPRNHVRLLWLLPPFVMQVFEVPARLVLGLYLVMDNLLPYLLASEGGGIAHGAHIGGFVAGLAAGWIMDRRVLGERPSEYAAARSAPAPADPGGQVADAIDARRLDEAAALYFRLPPHASRRVLSPEHSLALARWLVGHGHAEAGLVVARRHVRDFPGGPGVADAHVIAGQALLGEDQPTAAYQHFLSALDADPPPPVAAAARAGLAAIEALQKRRVGRPRLRGVG